MAFAAAALSGDVGNSWSIGPKKIQILSFSAASGDTSGSATATRLSRVDAAVVAGLVQTALPTYSGNVITLAFSDPLASVVGHILAIGV